jgi:hypothetical protein
MAVHLPGGAGVRCARDCLSPNQRRELSAAVGVESAGAASSVPSGPEAPDQAEAGALVVGGAAS